MTTKLLTIADYENILSAIKNEMVVDNNEEKEYLQQRLKIYEKLIDKIEVILGEEK